MSTLRVILDQAGDEHPSGIGRYALELTRHLIATTPRGSEVTGVVPASSEADYDRIARALPDLVALHKSALDRRQLAAVWQHGFTKLPGAGMVHAPSLLAPLYRHDRINNPGEQFVVTAHDAIALEHPELLTSRRAGWQRSMLKRAQRYADALVVPTHAVGDQISRHLDFGDRLRVIGGAPSSSFVVGSDADDRAETLQLPERYLVHLGTVDAASGVSHLIDALALDAAPDLPLVLVGNATAGIDVDALAAAAGLAESRVRVLGRLPDADVAVVVSRAAAAVVPSVAAGFGHSMLEAMSLRVPVVHSDAPALVEVAADAGHTVRLSTDGKTTAETWADEGYPLRLAEALREVVDDEAYAEQLRVRGVDRSGAYSWRDSAEKTWQLHADL